VERHRLLGVAENKKQYPPETRVFATNQRLFRLTLAIKVELVEIDAKSNEAQHY